MIESPVKWSLSEITFAFFAALDAKKAKVISDKLHFTGDSIIYSVDGKLVTKSDAEKLSAEQIASTKIGVSKTTTREGGLAQTFEKTNTVEITTKDGLAGWKARAVEGGGWSDNYKVEADNADFKTD